MSKNDRDYAARMEGCLYAIRQWQIYEKEGKDPIEEFKKEMKRRGFVRLDITMNEKEFHELVSKMSNNIYNNMLVTLMWALKESEGFGKQRLQRVKKAFDKAVEDTFELNYLCEHYVSMADYCVELNEKYDLGLNTDFVAANEADFDQSQRRFNHEKWLEGIIGTLRQWGYDEPADRFQKKLDNKVIDY